MPNEIVQTISPFSIALLSIIGSLVVVLFTILIYMGTNNSKKIDAITEQLGVIQLQLVDRVPWSEFKLNTEKCQIKIDEFGRKILRLEIIAKIDEGE